MVLDCLGLWGIIMLLNDMFLGGLLGYISPSFSLASIFIGNLVKYLCQASPAISFPLVCPLTVSFVS